MMKDAVEQYAERVEDGDKEKKRTRRRSNRRSKQQPSASASGEVSDCTQNGGTSNCVTASLSSSSVTRHGQNLHTSVEHGVTRASNFSFNSMPPMHIKESEFQFEAQGMKNQCLTSDSDRRMLSQSCPEPVTSEVTIGTTKNNYVITSSQVEGYARRKYFAPYWPMEEVNELLEMGNVFKALFRVNAHNRLEAYCKIDGVPTDILISGLSSQNRAVEGDIVVVKVDPFPLWTTMKGSNGNCSTTPSKHEPNGTACNGSKFKSKVVGYSDDATCSSSLPDERLQFEDKSLVGKYIQPEHIRHGYNYTNGYPCDSNYSGEGSSGEKDEATSTVENICAIISSYPSKRPTGKVVAILERSPRRDSIVGFLNVKQWLSYTASYKKEVEKNNSPFSLCQSGYIQLAPTDPRFPKMMVPVKNLPDSIKGRLVDGDLTVEMDLVAALIDDWSEENLIPEAHIVYVFGRGGEIQPHVNAILFENAISSADFSPEALACLPHVPWEVSQDEIQRRVDLRKLCIFTIDPSTATDLDDALSVEMLPNGIARIGVHIADVSYFVLPDTALDIEAKIRSTSVYLLQEKLPMLPPLLSENVCSLNPGSDKLAVTIFWDINSAGDVVDRWIGRSVIHSCCKLSYKHAQDIIDENIDWEHSNNNTEYSWPQLHGHFEWMDVIKSVRNLNGISKTLREKRVNDGALQFESSKICFLFDEDGIPYDSVLSEQKESNFLVEEFMLLANCTAAEVISKSFPDCALLRKHPEPNMRKLREFESFCCKHGLELDGSSSGNFHLSLERIREKLKDDSVLLGILISYATRPMQLASYFCSGELKDGGRDWSHYALAVPLYTHFTCPLRRYPDIVVHRTLAASIEAEELLSKNQTMKQKVSKVKKYFTGIYFDKDAAESVQGREALSAAAVKHRIPVTEILAELAAHCNARKLASRHVKDACDKLYMWFLLKKKEIILSEARVMGLGPKFMSIYIQKLGIERRIYYDEVEGLIAEWLETTSTLVLSHCAKKRASRRGTLGKFKAFEDAVHVVCPYDLKVEEGLLVDTVDKFGAPHDGGRHHLEPFVSGSGILDNEVVAAVFPLTVNLLSTISVALSAVGGHDGPLDIVARLYMSSYM